MVQQCIFDGRGNKAKTFLDILNITKGKFFTKLDFLSFINSGGDMSPFKIKDSYEYEEKTGDKKNVLCYRIYFFPELIDTPYFSNGDKSLEYCYWNDDCGWCFSYWRVKDTPNILVYMISDDLLIAGFLFENFVLIQAQNSPSALSRGYGRELFI